MEYTSKKTFNFNILNKKFFLPNEIKDDITQCLANERVLRVDTFTSKYLDDVNGSNVMIIITQNGKLVELHTHAFFEDEDDEDDEFVYDANTEYVKVRQISHVNLLVKKEVIDIYMDSLCLSANSLHDFCSGREDSVMVWTDKQTDLLEKFLISVTE